MQYDIPVGNVSNVQSITDFLTAADSQTFGYDDLNRLLTGSSSAYGTITYAYNQIGNMLSNSQVGTYSYPTSGASSVRPHAVSTAGSNSYTYDNNGNMLTGAGRTITYDFENRPTTIVSGGQTTTFTYDGDGGRVKKQTGSTVTWYISKLYECDGASCTKMIFSGDKRIVAKPVGQSSLYFYHGDHLGSTSVVTDNTGTQVEALTYYPFGQTRTNVPGTPVNVAHKYTGKELDNATGLYFYEARYYDAILCRFISADTLVGNPKDPQDLNRYGYARNNPLKYTDPTGHFVEWVIAVAIVAGAVTAGIQSDWNPKAVVLGAVIAGASAAAGSAAGIYVSSSLGAGALAGGVIGGIAGGLTYATLNQLAGNKANWGPSIAYGGVAGGVAAGVGGAVSTFTDSQAVQAIVGAVAAGATRAGLGGGNIVKGALMSAAVAAVTTYLVVEYGTSPAEAQVKAQEDNASRALQTQQSDLGQRAGMFGAGPLIEYLGGYVLSSRIGLTLTEMLMADAGYLGYNRSTGLMQFEKAGGFGEANRLFDSFLAEGGTLLRSQESGLRVLQYGRDTFITVRPYSSGGFPTLDVHTPELIFKFRF